MPATLTLFISISSFAFPHRRNLWHDATGSSTWLKVNLPNDVAADGCVCPVSYTLHAIRYHTRTHTFFKNQRVWAISTKVGYGSVGIMTNEAFNVAHRNGIAGNWVHSILKLINWMWTFFFYVLPQIRTECRTCSTMGWHWLVSMTLVGVVLALFFDCCCSQLVSAHMRIARNKSDRCVPPNHIHVRKPRKREKWNPIRPHVEANEANETNGNWNMLNATRTQNTDENKWMTLPDPDNFFHFVINAGWHSTERFLLPFHLFRLNEYVWMPGFHPFPPSLPPLTTLSLCWFLSEVQKMRLHYILATLFTAESRKEQPKQSSRVVTCISVYYTARRIYVNVQVHPWQGSSLKRIARNKFEEEEREKMATRTKWRRKLFETWK